MPRIHPKTWEDGVMPLSEFVPEKRTAIEEAVKRKAPPPRWVRLVGGQIQSRAWWEWHWERGLQLRHVPGPGRRKIPDAVRFEVYERDDSTCQHCGTNEQLSLDHIHPHSLGGADTIDNLQTLCRPCNSRKGAKV